MRVWLVAWAFLLAGAAPDTAAWVAAQGCGGTECSTTVTYLRPPSWRDVSTPGSWEFVLASDRDPAVRFSVTVVEGPARSAPPLDGVPVGHNALRVTGPDEVATTVDVAVVGAEHRPPAGAASDTLSETYRVINHGVARDVVVVCATPPELARAYDATCRRLLRGVSVETE